MIEVPNELRGAASAIEASTPQGFREGGRGLESAGAVYGNRAAVVEGGPGEGEEDPRGKGGQGGDRGGPKAQREIMKGGRNGKSNSDPPVDDPRLAEEFYVDRLSSVRFEATEDVRAGVPEADRRAISLTLDCPMSSVRPSGSPHSSQLEPFPGLAAGDREPSRCGLRLDYPARSHGRRGLERGPR